MRLFRGTSRGSGSRIDEELFLRAARAYALRRYPNPERKGCPPGQEIEHLARRAVPLSRMKGHIEHIATCSPCLSQYLAEREGWEKRRRRRIAILAAVAGIVFAIAGVTLLRSLPVTQSEPPRVVEEQTKPHVQLQAATLDLRPLEPTRGERKASPRIPVLARANLRLALLLPVGSSEGDYEFEIRDDRGEPQIRGSGNAFIRNYITTIETALDLRSVAPGRFVLAIRRGGDSAWRSYQFEVQ